MSIGYVELHAKSFFSFGEGASHVHELAARAVELGQPALALTDTNMCGALEFANLGDTLGLKPITGGELTLSDGSGLTLLAKSRTGYSNLSQLFTFANQTDRREPRLDPVHLPDHADGLIALAGGRDGRLSKLLMDGRHAEAKDCLRQLMDWYGPDSVYIELRRNLLDGDTRRNRRLVGLARETGARLVATNAVLYHAPERYRLQHALVAIRNNSTIDSSLRLILPNDQSHLKSGADMKSLFADCPEAVEATLEIAERCEFDLSSDLGYTLPEPDVPEGYTPVSYLARLCYEAATRRYGSITGRIESRLREEFRLIERNGMAGFLLLYREIALLAREIMEERGLVGPEVALEERPPGRGRGSSVALLAGYLVGISHVDPLKWELTLERFISERSDSLPDIDLDFPRAIRDELIERVHRRFGSAFAVLTGAISTYRSRGVIRDLGAALGLPQERLKLLAGRMHDEDMSALGEKMSEMPEFRDSLETSGWRNFAELAPQLIGAPKSLGQHVGGMILSSSPIPEMVPVRAGAMDGRYIMDWDKDSVADAGFAKVRVTSTDGGGNEETLTSAATEPVLGDGLPGAPRNLTATPGNREVTLSWEPPADNGNAPASRYRIEWRIDGKDYDKNQWGTSRSTTYTTNDQANLANGVKYFFRVKAENGSGNSYGPYGPASEEVSATPTSGSAVDLGTPVLSDTETLHHGMVRLDWEDIEDAGWYVVQYYHVEGGEWLDLPAEGVDIAFHGSRAVVSNLHGLSWLRVRAMSCAGESEWSQIEQLFGTNASDWDGVPVPEVEEGDEIEPCPVVLGTPVLSDTEDLHHGMVQLDWQDIEDAGWYVVQYYHLEGGEWLDLPAAGVDIAFHGSSAVVSNLHGLSWLRVRAMSCAGESEWSQIEQLFGTNASDWEGVPVPEVAEGDEIEPCDEDPDTSDNSPATGAPTITGTAQVGETLTADTSDIADANGLSNVQYEYQWLADDSDIAGASGSTYTPVAADEGKAIKVEVSFTDDAGNDESLTSEPTAVVAAALPPPPDNVRAVAKKSGAVELTWDAPQDATVTGYRIERRPTGGSPSDQGRSAGSPRDNHTLVEDTGSADTGYTDNTAERGVGYEYRVSARNEAGAGEESDWVNAEEAASNSTATGAPTISGTVQVGETLTANTSGITDQDGLSNVQYEYQWLADDSEIAGATGLTYTLTDSEESKAITVRVSFTDDADHEETLTSAATDIVAGAQPTEPPAKPRGLDATATHDSVTLTWDDPGDDTITGYVILRRIPGVDPEGHFDVLVADTGRAAATYTDDTVSAETRYTYRIKAINGAGTSERSRWSHIDTPAAPVPDKPTGLEATESHGRVVLTWEDPGDDSITGYVILRRVRENNTGGDFSVLVADTGSAATTYTDDTVAASTTYTYRIKAINEHGTSERSRWYHIDIPEAP